MQYHRMMSSFFRRIGLFLLLLVPFCCARDLSASSADSVIPGLSSGHPPAYPFIGTSLSDTLGGHILPGHIVFRLKPEMAPFGKSDGIDHHLFSKAMQEIRPGKLRRVFPHHEPPLQKTHPTGEKLIDLSLIYEMVLGSHDDMFTAINALLQTGMVEYAEPRYIPVLLYTIDEEKPGMYIPNDSLLFTQYYLQNINAFEAWAIAQGDTNVFVAIVDTGNDFSHPDLVDAVRYNYDDPVNGEDSDHDGYVDNFYGWNLGEDNNFPQYNRHGHGVHVSGISSATADNSIGIAGTGFHARYLPVKVDDEHGRLVKAYEGIVYAADQGAAVINCSWGSHFGGGHFGHDVVRYATLNRDALVVAGAGNAGNAAPFYPASYDYVLGVAATDSLDAMWSQSSFGLFVGLAAPGVRMLSTWPGNMYIRSSGTSMSSPLVAGAAALVRSHFPELSALQIAARLQATTDPIDSIAANADYAGLLGAGRLNMLRALTDPFTPYMRIAGRHLDENEYGTFRAGQSMPIALDFQNLLAPATNITAILTAFSPHVAVLNERSALGAAATLEIVSNAHQPFVLELGEDTPMNHTIPFFVEFFEQDTVAVGRQGFIVVVNTDFINIDAGKISTTITSKGAIGFNYPNYAQGQGVLVNRSFTQVKCAGLVLGEKPDRVVDNIYGDGGHGFSRDFAASTPLSMVAAPDFADIEIAGRFHDREAGDRMIGLDMDHHTYFWKSAPRSSFFITEYLLTNNSGRTLRSFHTGFFVDWASRNSIGMQVRFSDTHQLSYVNIDDGRFAGLQALTGDLVCHYAFDNDGYNNSIRINNGFDMADKYLAMTSNRHEAGSYRTENDVSSMMSTGPHFINNGHGLRLAFAWHTAESLDQLYLNATEAMSAYQEILTGEPVRVAGVQTDDRHIITPYPNPFNSVLKLRHTGGKPHSLHLTLLNAQGIPVIERHIPAGMATESIITLETAHLPPGPYFLMIRRNDQVSGYKLLKI